MNVRQTITQLYHDYEHGRTEKILAVLPDDFVFEYSSDPSMVRDRGVCRSKNELLQHLATIAQHFHFSSYHATNILVDGDHAAAQIQVGLTFKPNGRSFSTTIAHFWSFTDGVPVRLVEYMDSALVGRLCAGTEGGAAQRC